jgi:hypothetical protein
MSESEHLSQAERLIAECKNHIARQHEVMQMHFRKVTTPRRLYRCCEHWRHHG